MCDDHVPAGLTRRQVLNAAGGLASAGLLLGRGAGPPRRLPLQSKARLADANGNQAYSMAMHVHSSFSEYSGSMDCQLYQAARNGVDVLWWTEHDGRMNNLDYRDQVHFTSLDNENGAPGQGRPWLWQAQSAGPVATSGGGIVKTPCSPSDPVSGGALEVAVKSKSSKQARHGYYANSLTAQLNYRDSLQGQALTIDVLLSPGWSRGFLEILIGSSYHQASGGRPAGLYSLSYQVGPEANPGRSAAGNEGIVRIPAEADGQWHTITITPQDDLAAIFPDLDSRDFGLYAITLNAVSTGDSVQGYFDYLRFNRAISGEVAYQAQASMMTALAGKYPGVRQHQGLELSMTSQTTHVNWFGADPHILNYGLLPQKQWNAYLQETAIPQIHQGGGLASYNHPFGVLFGPLLSGKKQHQALVWVAKVMLGNKALGADLLEVGYPLRGQVNLAHHVGLWDVMSRNALFLTGNGTNDNHVGTDWLHGTDSGSNNFATGVWAASHAQSDLLAALVAGRAWCGSLSEFALPAGAALDLVADGTCPMGSASVSKVTSRHVTLTAAGLPSGGKLQLLQGSVDYAGTADPAPDTKMIASYTAAQLNGSHQVTRAVDTSADSFVRTQVLDSAGTVVAMSNPLWLFQNPPPNGIPPPRRV